MTPKIKAKELVDKFIEMNQQHSSETNEEYGNSYLYHKKCALISVSETIAVLEKLCESKSYDPFEAPIYDLEELKQVREQLKKP